MTLLELNLLTLITTDMQIRELLNGALFIMCTNLAAILFYFMGWTWWGCKGTATSWRRVEGIQTACVLAWVFAIIGFRSGLVWLSLKLTNDGIKSNFSFEHIANWSLILSACLLILLTARGTYIWTPPRWHNKAWMVSSFVTVLFLIASEYLA